MIGGRSAETIRVVRDRIDDCQQPRCRNVKITLAAAGPSIDVSGLGEELWAPGLDGYPRVPVLIRLSAWSAIF